MQRSHYAVVFQSLEILSPDEIERLAEKLVTHYQDDIEQRFSNELYQFVDYLFSINDICNVYNLVKCILFADDTNVVCARDRPNQL